VTFQLLIPRLTPVSLLESREIGLDSLLQKPPFTTSKNRTIQPGDAFEDIALKNENRAKLTFF
jgi:hypothetical protein